MALTNSGRRLVSSTWWSRNSWLDQRTVLASFCRGLFGGKRESFKPHSKVLGYGNSNIYEMQSEYVYKLTGHVHYIYSSSQYQA